MLQRLLDAPSPTARQLRGQARPVRARASSTDTPGADLSVRFQPACTVGTTG